MSISEPGTGDAIGDGDAVGVAVGDGVTVGVAVGLAVAVGVEVGVGVAVAVGVAVGGGVNTGVGVGEGVDEEPDDPPPPCPAAAAIPSSPAPPRTPKSRPVLGPEPVGGGFELPPAIGAFVVHCAVAKPGGGVNGVSGGGNPNDGCAGTTTDCVPIGFPAASNNVKYTVVAVVGGVAKITTGVKSTDPGDGTSEHDPISELSGVAVVGGAVCPTGGTVGGAVGTGVDDAANAGLEETIKASVVNAPTIRTLNKNTP